MQLKKSSFNFKSSFVCIVLSFMITTYRYILLLMWSQSCVQFEELAVASLQVLIISLVFSDIKTQWTSLWVMHNYGTSWTMGEGTDGETASFTAVFTN